MVAEAIENYSLMPILNIGCYFALKMNFQFIYLTFLATLPLVLILCCLLNLLAYFAASERQRPRGTEHDGARHEKSGVAPRRRPGHSATS